MLDEYQREEALIHFRRGLFLERVHRVVEAVEEYRQAIAHDPYLREARDALGSYYQRHGLLAKAAEEFRIVAAAENDFLSHFNFGCVLLELGRHEEALAAFQRCLAIEPNDAASRYEIALIMFHRGEYTQAIGLLQTPISHFPDDWEVHHLLGNCHVQLGQYEDALAAFGKALPLAPTPTAQTQIVTRLYTIERYRELGTPRCAKDRLYAEHGVVLLGSTQDDGVMLNEADDYHFTYPDIGATVRRFLALHKSLQWLFTCVVALDRQATPLASALAELLNLPLCATHEIQPNDLPLLVLAVGREDELLKLALERAPGEVVTFCLGLNWLRHGKLLPDISGMIARGACSVPWEPELRRLRSDGAKPAKIEACQQRAAQHILSATHDAPADPHLPRQIAFYQRYQKLRFVDVFEAVATSSSL